MAFNTTEQFLCFQNGLDRIGKYVELNDSFPSIEFSFGILYCNLILFIC